MLYLWETSRPTRVAWAQKKVPSICGYFFFSIGEWGWQFKNLKKTGKYEKTKKKITLFWRKKSNLRCHRVKRIFFDGSLPRIILDTMEMAGFVHWNSRFEIRDVASKSLMQCCYYSYYFLILYRTTFSKQNFSITLRQNAQ